MLFVFAADVLQEDVETEVGWNRGFHLRISGDCCELGKLVIFLKGSALFFVSVLERR